MKSQLWKHRASISAHLLTLNRLIQREAVRVTAKIHLRSLLLGTVFVVIALTISVEFRRLQNTPDHAELPQSDMSLSDRDKTYIDKSTDLSKWLTGIAYALLAGLVTRRLAGDAEKRFRSMSCILGVGLLILSLYAGFLSYEAVLIVTSSKPTWMIRSRLTSFPVESQLWLLAAATVSLVFTFFTSKPEVERRR
jgi:hypothetical protein